MIFDIDLSVVIPCVNERNVISLCLEALLRQKTERSIIEIIVIDNGSTDGTLEILQTYSSKIRLFQVPRVSISELRNFGVQQARGEWVAFIDADVEVSSEWFKNLRQVLYKMHEENQDIFKIITGSTYAIPEQPSWIERVWFGQLKARDQDQSNYINGGNLVVSKKLFNQIRGFRPEYRTGEDVRFCQDAIAIGGKILPIESISAIHHGYPKTIKDFFRRERWHGIGMKNYLFRPWKSRDLTLAYYFIVITGLFIISMICSMNMIAFITAIWLLLQLLPISILAWYRSRIQRMHFFSLTLLYFIYGWARVFSLIDLMKRTR
jgi:glycosyltransferase involved in cell wall biosynthesis